MKSEPEELIVSTSVQPRTGYEFIDWLRGIAALLVVFFHFDLHIFNNYPARPVPDNSFTAWFVFGGIDLGKLALGIFFMVSGFLIPSTLAKPGSSLRKYAIHRFFRLYPSYWISILVFLVVATFLGDNQVSASQIAVNTTMMQRFVGVPDIIGVYWTLQIELIFYVLCALLFLRGLLSYRRQIFMICLAGALALAAARYFTGKNLPVALFIALSLMFLGDSVRATCDGRMEKAMLGKLTCAMLVALLPICMLAYADGWLRYVSSYWIAIGVFLFAATPFFSSTDLPFLSPVRHLLANCSYSVYLLHDPIGMNLTRFLFQTTSSVWISGIAGISATFLAGYLIFNFVELPCIRLGKKIADSPRWKQGK